MGTWNIRSVKGKEREMIQEIERANLEILAITETKKKGRGIMTIGDYGVIYSGAEENQRAEAGVGCVVSPEYMGKLVDWQGINERIMKVKIQMIEKETIEIIIVYGPNENDRITEKEAFWKSLQEVCDEVRNPLIIMGDLNARIGNNTEGTEGVMGRYGETAKNRNGSQLIDFCIQNGLIIQNSFFQHKDCHKYTREEPSRNEKSIIDYIITERTNRKIIRDVRVFRSAELGTDHYLVVAKVKCTNVRKLNTKTGSACKEKKAIKIHKLQDAEVENRYIELVSMLVGRRRDEIKQANLEEKWRIFKMIINEAAVKSCGVALTGGSRKRSSWWSDEIKEMIRDKKMAWKEYLRGKTREKYEKYKETRKTVKTKVKEAKAKEWEDFGEKMENDSKSNQKLFYRVLKNMRSKGKTKVIGNLKDREGRIITDIENILPRWREYFQEMLGSAEINEDEVEILNLNNEQSEEITKEEIEQAVKRLKNGKAPGNDNIKAEMYKHMGDKGIEILHEIIDTAWRTKEVPEDWKTQTIIPIYKKGDKTDCRNYRGITLTCTACKVYEIILEKRLREIVEEKLHETQSGFRPGYSTQDHVFTIRNLTEKFLAYNKNMYLCFIDLEKAFDKVPRNLIWKALRNLTVSSNLIEAVKALYRGSTSKIRTHNQETEKFKTTQGVIQGGVLSPLLFIIFMNEIITKATKQSKKIDVGYNRLQNITMSECIFADDMVLIANNQENLQYNIDIWSKLLLENGMRINADKTKVMVISNAEININIKMNETPLEQVGSIKYLGTIIDKTGRYEEEINSRITSATKLYHSIRNGFINKKEISTKTKLTIYKTIYLPTLTYGSETWVLTEKLKRKIQVMEMKYLRRVANVTLVDKIRNDTIRERLGVESVGKYIEKSQLRWWGHLNRLNQNRQVKKIWGATKIGKKRRGKPRMTWDNEVAKLLREKGITWREAERLSRDRRQWRKLVDGK